MDTLNTPYLVKCATNERIGDLFKMFYENNSMIRIKGIMELF